MQEQAKYKFSLALVFYNEEDNVVPVVNSLKEVLNRSKLDCQLILVDNGSRDHTSRLIRELVSVHRDLKPVMVEDNLGYGWGVINGLSAAEGEWIGFMDGDAQIASGDVERFLAEADSSRYDMIKARRLERRDGFIRARVSEVYVILFCLLFGIKIYDVNAKPVIFKRKYLDRFSLKSRDWFIDAELLMKASFLGLRIREVGMIFHRRQAGRTAVNVATIFEFINNIARNALGGEFARWKKNQR